MAVALNDILILLISTTVDPTTYPWISQLITWNSFNDEQSARNTCKLQRKYFGKIQMKVTKMTIMLVKILCNQNAPQRRIRKWWTLLVLWSKMYKLFINSFARMLQADRYTLWHVEEKLSDWLTSFKNKSFQDLNINIIWKDRKVKD